MSHPDLTLPRLDRRQLLAGAGAGIAIAALGTSAASAASVAAQRVAAGTAAAPVLQLARVWGDGVVDLSSFDDTHVVFDDGSVELLLWPGDLARLQATGLRHQVTVTDLARRDAALRAGAPARASFDVLKPQPGEATEYRYYQPFPAAIPGRRYYVSDMQELARRFPDKARVFTLPETTLEGRTVYGIEIARDVAKADGRPVFYQDGCHHAREWPAAEMCMMWAYDLLENDGKDERITALMTGARHVIVPVVNPDGFTHSRTSPAELSNLGTLPPGGLEAYWRKNRRSVSGALYAAGGVTETRGNADAYGIDPNRNYAYRWGGDGSSSSTTVQDSRGPAPFSEPESRNVRWALSRWQATASNSNHTAGNLILRAWGDTKADSPDEDILKPLGDKMGEYTGYRSQKSIQLYVTTGTCSDFMYGAYGSLGFTFEHSGGGFHPAYASTVPAMYAKVRPAFLLLAEAAMNPEWHGVIRGRLVDANGQPVAGTVKITKDVALPLWPNNPAGRPTEPHRIDNVPVATAPDGTFELHVNPSTLPIRFVDGAREYYQLQGFVGSASTGKTDVYVERGQVVPVGDIRIV